MTNDTVIIDYTNYKGERGTRVIRPNQIFFGQNEWHPDPQWLLTAYDLEKDALRVFAVGDIHKWTPQK